MTRRVVITAVGIASPIGIGAEVVWNALLAGESGLETFEDGPLSRIPPAAGGRTPVPMKIGRDYYDPKVLRNATMNNATILGVVATGDCLDRAGLVGDKHRRIGCYIGTEMPYPEHAKQARGALTLMERDESAEAGWSFNDERLGASMRFQSAFEFLRSLPNMSASHVSIRGGFQGPVATFLGSGASGIQAILEATREIRAGHAEGMMAGGAWSPYAPLYQGFLARTGRIGYVSGDVTAAMRPFDRSHIGAIPGEAGCVFLLEELGSARERGATILAEVTGGATQFAAPGHGDQEAACQTALRLGIPQDHPLDVIAATGSGHPELDRLEGQAWARFLGAERAGQLPWLFPTASTGYTGSAAAPLAAAAAIFAMRDGKLPPTVNLHEPDPQGAAIVPREAVETATIRGAGVSAFSFEGIHATLSLQSWSEASE